MVCAVPARHVRHTCPDAAHSSALLSLYQLAVLGLQHIAMRLVGARHQQRNGWVPPWACRACLRRCRTASEAARPMAPCKGPPASLLGQKLGPIVGTQSLQRPVFLPRAQQKVGAQGKAQLQRQGRNRATSRSGRRRATARAAAAGRRRPPQSATSLLSASMSCLRLAVTRLSPVMLPRSPAHAGTG